MSNSTLSHEVSQRRRLVGVLPLLALAQLIISIDYNIVFVSLPAIGRDLDFSVQTLQSVISAYAVAFAGFLLLGGRAADLLGRRRVFALGLGLYAAASLAGGLAVTPWMLVSARTVQGLGGALLFPSTLALVNTTFEQGPERNRALGVWSAAGASGLSLGALLGGALTGAFGWPSVFLVNVPLAGGAALLAFRLLPADPPRQRTRRFDLSGALTATAGFTLLVFALVQGPTAGWLSPSVLVSGALAIALLVALLVIESRVADPLMPLRLFHNRNLSTASVVMFLFQGIFSALLYFLTLYLQDVRGYGAVATGLGFLPLALIIMIGTQLSPKLLARIGLRTTLALGQTISAVGIVLLALGLTPTGGYFGLLPGIVVLSIGNGLTWTGMFSAAGRDVAAGEQGVASGMASTARQVGSAVGLALLVIVALGSHAAARVPAAVLTGGLRHALLIAAGFSLVGAIVSLIGLAKQNERGSQHG